MQLLESRKSRIWLQGSIMLTMRHPISEKLAQILPTSGSRLASIVRLQAKAIQFSLQFFFPLYIQNVWTLFRLHVKVQFLDSMELVSCNHSFCVCFLEFVELNRCFLTVLYIGCLSFGVYCRRICKRNQTVTDILVSVTLSGMFI